MKKSVLVLLSFLICIMSINLASAKTTSKSALSSAIRTYKAGNYVQAYNAFSDIVKKDPSNAVAQYYLAISCAQVGKKDEAIAGYDKVLTLTQNGQLQRYAQKGKKCIETPDKCNEPVAGDTEMDRFIRSRFGSGFSNEARSEYEKQKIENLMREMNRGNDITPQKFKDYKDFSGEVPTNDEIVAALRTLQKAGFSDLYGNSYNNDLSVLTGTQNNSGYDMLHMLLGNRNGNSQLSPQVIQAMLTSQMSTGF